MPTIEALKREIEKLTPEELAAFRDCRVWDTALERAVTAGKLDKFAAEALEEHARGKTTEIESCDPRDRLSPQSLLGNVLEAFRSSRGRVPPYPMANFARAPPARVRRARNSRRR